MHPDPAVDDLDAVTHARDVGAVLAAHQPQDDVRVRLLALHRLSRDVDG